MTTARVPPGGSHPTADAFLNNVLRSGLLGRDALDAALRRLPHEVRDNAEAFANYLVRAGKLSRFQAHKLMQGAVRGLVLGPYQVLAPLGKGGTGRVYLARDNRNEQLVALKVLPPKLAREKERALARFRREISLSQLVSHPQLSHFHEAGVHQGIYYIAMEFIPGKTLSRLVNSHGPLPLARACRLFAEVAEGLDYAHGLGVIHRDLKPSNVIVTPHDHAKVLDLGLAILEGEEVTDRSVVGGRGYVVGTMDYLAPEQAENAVNVDARADIYSLGCTLYFVLAGQPPFPGGDTRQKILRHYSEEATPAHELNPAVPPLFNAVLRRLMAKRPEERPRSMAEVRHDLLAWAAGEPAPPPDSQADAAYQRAVDEAQSADEVSDMFGEDIVSASRLAPLPEPAPRRSLLVVYVAAIAVLAMALFIGWMYLILR